MKNEKFIQSIKDVISGLEARTIVYKPDAAPHNNVGIVVQSLLNLTPQDVYNRIKYDLDYSEKQWKFWVRVLKHRWPIGHTPTGSLFKALHKLRLDREDFGHLTYLSDVRVLREAGMGETTITKYKTVTNLKKVPVFHEIKHKKDVYRNDWWGKIWGLKKTEEWTEKIQIDWEYKNVDEKIPDGEEVTFDPSSIDCNNVNNYYYYLKAWVSIMEKELNEKV